MLLPDGTPLPELTDAQVAEVRKTCAAEGFLPAVKLVRGWYDVSPEPRVFHNLHRAKGVVELVAGDLPKAPSDRKPGYVEILTDHGHFRVWDDSGKRDGVIAGVERWVSDPWQADWRVDNRPTVLDYPAGVREQLVHNDRVRRAS
jgi:hypothetical protein